MQFIILAALVSTAKTVPAVPNLPVNETRKTITTTSYERAAPFAIILSLVKAGRPTSPTIRSLTTSARQAKVKISENCKLATDWDKKSPDETIDTQSKPKEL